MAWAWALPGGNKYVATKFSISSCVSINIGNTVDESIIGAPKMRNNFGSLFICTYCNSNIVLFSIAPHLVNDL